MTTLYNINEIMKGIPHRYPFLLIDRVLDINEDKTVAHVLKNITVNEPQFTGHFPDFPIMPGVLLIEAMAQACATLAVARLTDEEKKQKSLFYFAGIDHARFKRMVVPGDQVIFECHYVKERSGIYWYSAKATVDGHIAAEADLMCARRPVNEEAGKE